MKGRINFVLPNWMKLELDYLTRQIALAEGQAVSNGELIRRALIQVYNLGNHRKPPKKKKQKRKS